MQAELSKRCQDNLTHLCALTGVEGFLLDVSARSIPFAAPAAHFCEGCGCARCRALDTHAYGANEAYRWNGKYIYYCPLGLTFAASSVSDETGALCACLVMGPLLMGERQDALAELADAREAQRAAALPAMEPAQVTHLSAVLAAVTSYAAGLPHSHAGSFVYEQEKLLNAIYTARDRISEGDESENYPIEYEKRLHQLVAAHDKSGAQEMLNELLGHIYCASLFDLPSIKTRVVELVVLLSRATIDAGADVQEVFLCNENYIQEIERFDSLETLSVWLTGIMHRFVNYSFVFTQIKHTDVVYKVMDYVRRHYARKITLDDLAQNVHLSRSYLSRIFKEETGQSLVGFINGVRVEKSKMFLMDKNADLAQIAGLCGFEDQSYFTKVFKSVTGLSPKKYRDSRGLP